MRTIITQDSPLGPMPWSPSANLEQTQGCWWSPGTSLRHPSGKSWEKNLNLYLCNDNPLIEQDTVTDKDAPLSRTLDNTDKIFIKGKSIFALISHLLCLCRCIRLYWIHILTDCSEIKLYAIVLSYQLILIQSFSLILLCLIVIQFGL